MVAGVVVEETGPDCTRVNCRTVDVEAGTGDADSTTTGALSERERDARLLLPEGEGECSGDGVFMRTNSPCELVKYGNSGNSRTESSERDGDGCAEDVL